MDYLCPNDGAVLEPATLHGGRALVCPRCKSEMINVAVLKHDPAVRAAVQSVWDRARSGVVDERACPLCGELMHKAAIPGRTEKVDVCLLCQAMWLNPGEFDLLPRQTPEEQAAAQVEEFPPEAQAVFAEFEKAERREKSMVNRNDTITELPLYKRILALFWLPVRDSEDEVYLDRTPLVTLLLIALLVIGFGFAMGRTVLAAQRFGFRVDMPLRHGGLTLLTSFFLQINFIHLLYNIAFLKVFGEEVEDELGRLGYLLLIVAGHVAGLVTFVLFTSSQQFFIVGASSGISAVFAFYLCTFRERRFNITFWWFFRWYLFKAPAYYYIAPWLVVHVLATLLQISYARCGAMLLFYVGGAVVGLLWAYFYRHRA